MIVYMSHNCFNSHHTPLWELIKRIQYVTQIKRLKSATTDPLLPALVEGLGLVHAVPVAAKVAAVPVVAEVAVLVAKVAAVATSLVELQGETEGVREEPGEEARVKDRDRMINAGFPFSKVVPCQLGGFGRKETQRAAHLTGMPSVAAAAHVGSASSAHVSSL